MASPPYRSPATSPPYPPHMPLPNSKKRPSLNMPSHAPAVKRQKRSSIHSVASSAHPLRQTSFPPEESAIRSGARSPSVDSEFTAVTGGKSVVTSAGKGKKGRGRGKAKADGTARSVGRGKTAESERQGTAEVPDDEDEDDDGNEGMVDDGEAVDKLAEKKKLDILIAAFNEDQSERHTMLRRCKLKKEVVRKITNQTVSQSVPASVITTINGYTKIFIGTLVERAREVQQQWAALDTPPDTPPKVNIDPTDFHKINPNNDIFAARETGGDAFSDLTMAAQIGIEKSGKGERLRDLGPLLPDHFREALRRYKRDGEGGGTGLAGVSVRLGLPGTGSARLGGKRLFK